MSLKFASCSVAFLAVAVFSTVILPTASAQPPNSAKGGVPGDAGVPSNIHIPPPDPAKAIDMTAILRQNPDFAKRTLFANLTPSETRELPTEMQDQQNLAIIDKLLTQLKPGETSISLGDTAIEAVNIRQMREDILARLKPGKGGPRLPAASTGPSWNDTSARLWWHAPLLYPEVPYTINSNVSSYARPYIMEGIYEMENACWLWFHPKNAYDPNWIDFERNIDPNDQTGSSQWVGKASYAGPQYILLPDSFSRGVVCHEIGHAIGLIHEHQRSDRGAFVTINNLNIQPGRVSQFDPPVPTYALGSYDYLSIMHYSGNAFAINSSLITIQTTDPAYQSLIGQADTYSDADRVGLMNLNGYPEPAAYWGPSQQIHGTGHPDGDGWAVTVGVDSANWLTIGPYTTNIGEERQAVLFELSVDSTTPISDPIGMIDVYNGTRNQVVYNGPGNLDSEMGYPKQEVHYAKTTQCRLQN